MKKTQNQQTNNLISSEINLMQIPNPSESLTPTTTVGLSFPKPYIATQWRPRPRVYEADVLKSATVPGQSQSLKNIMAKYKVGIPPNGYRPIYSENTDTDLGINPKSLDYVDIQNMSEENLTRINQLNSEREKIISDHKELQNQKQMEAFEKKIRDKIEEENRLQK